MKDFSRPTAHPRARFFRHAAIITVAIYIALLIWASLMPVVPGAQDVSDKVLHFIAYGLLTGLAAAAWPRAKLWTLFITVSFIGAALEGAQGILDIGRMASWADQIANMIGSALVILLWMGMMCLYSALGPNRSPQ